MIQITKVCSDLMDHAVEYQAKWVEKNTIKSSDDPMSTPIEYDIGDLVLYKPPEGNAHKIQPAWLGPVVVTGRHDLNAYVVHDCRPQSSTLPWSSG